MNVNKVRNRKAKRPAGLWPSFSGRGHDDLIEYERLDHGEAAVPTNNHYLSLLYAISLQ